MSGFDEAPWANLQFKNTDICLDMVCECNHSGHYDGYFGQHFVCPECDAHYRIPNQVPFVKQTPEEVAEYESHFGPTTRAYYRIGIDGDVG